MRLPFETQKLARWAMVAALSVWVIHPQQDLAAQKLTSAAAASQSEGPSTRLVLLGTAGGPVPRAKRSQPASLLQVGDRFYLIDAGDGVSRQLASLGLLPKNVSNVFLTHLHMDHMAGLSTLMAMRWVEHGRDPLQIFGPNGTNEIVDGALRFTRVPEIIFAEQFPPGPSIRQLVQSHEIDSVGPVVVYKDDRVTVTAVQNTHYRTMAPVKIAAGGKSYSYRFDTPDRSIVFTGDTGESPGVTKLATGADILVSEIIDVPAVLAYLRDLYKMPDKQLTAVIDHMKQEHLTPEQVGELATRARVKMVVLTHIVPGDDTETDFRKYIQGVKDRFNGAVVIGQDFDQF